MAEGGGSTERSEAPGGVGGAETNPTEQETKSGTMRPASYLATAPARSGDTSR